MSACDSALDYFCLIFSLRRGSCGHFFSVWVVICQFGGVGLCMRVGFVLGFVLSGSGLRALLIRSDLTARDSLCVQTCRDMVPGGGLCHPVSIQIHRLGLCLSSLRKVLVRQSLSRGQ